MEPLVWLLIGHRGVGKTTLLKHLEKTLPNIRTVDLDQEIEIRTGMPILKLFEAGEAQFRTLEREILEDVAASADKWTIIAVGAGFEGAFPPKVKVVWIRRSTDADGRVFLDRPRLNPQVTHLQEYQERFETRERRFLNWADEILWLPEGYEAGLDGFFTNSIKIPFDLTLMPENLRDWKSFADRRKSWGIRKWEFRDDLLKPDDMREVLSSLKDQAVVFSHRLTREKAELASSGKGATYEQISKTCEYTDWPLELGAAMVTPEVISLHVRQKDFEATLSQITSFKGPYLKLAVEVENFAELLQGHEWWQEDPAHRAFLPRSNDGRWRWYRSLYGPRMPIHFFREGEGSGLDQPLLWQCLLQPIFKEKFAAVLGSPVEHSRSPMEHLEFFKAPGIPFVAVKVSEAEWDQAWPVLLKLGLRFAAVTSPLKKIALKVADTFSNDVRELQALNTLTIVQVDGKFKVRADNTDVQALQRLKSELPSFASIAVWGGGGIKSSLQKVWPEARMISARLGDPQNTSFEMVIWAAGRTHGFSWPSDLVKPQLILDLNYSADSPGLEWAARANLPYQSGLRMFKLQAEFQRQIWREYI